MVAAELVPSPILGPGGAEDLLRVARARIRTLVETVAVVVAVVDPRVVVVLLALDRQAPLEQIRTEEREAEPLRTRGELAATSLPAAPAEMGRTASHPVAVVAAVTIGTSFPLATRRLGVWAPEAQCGLVTDHCLVSAALPHLMPSR